MTRAAPCPRALVDGVIRIEGKLLHPYPGGYTRRYGARGWVRGAGVAGRRGVYGAGVDVRAYFLNLNDFKTSSKVCEYELSSFDGKNRTTQ